METPQPLIVDTPSHISGLQSSMASCVIDSLRSKTVMRQKHTHKNGYSSKTNKHVCQEVLPL